MYKSARHSAKVLAGSLSLSARQGWEERERNSSISFENSLQMVVHGLGPGIIEILRFEKLTSGSFSPQAFS